MDGANVEMREEMGEDNIFIFGMVVDEVMALERRGYNPWDFYNSNQTLQEVLNQIRDGYFCPEDRDLFKPIWETLMVHGDKYMLCADFQSYIDCQRRVDECYKDQKAWLTKAVHNIASVGKFSSDRTIREYAKDIWDAECRCN
jgi:starch phosphorylase